MRFNGLDPLLPTPMPRDTPDGTTAWSDEVGLPGKPRLLAWTVVQDDHATFDIHVLWDTPELDKAMDAALAHAQAFFGPNLTGGVVVATLNSADNAVDKRFGSDGWLADRGATSPHRPSLDDSGKALLVDEPSGEARRQVYVSRTDHGGLQFEGTDSGPPAASPTDDDEFDFYYVVPPDRMSLFVERTGVDPSDLIGNLVAGWSERFDELERLMNDLGIRKFLI